MSTALTEDAPTLSAPRHALFVLDVLAREGLLLDVAASLAASTSRDGTISVLLTAAAPAVADVVTAHVGHPWRAEIEVQVDLFVVAVADDVKALLQAPGVWGAVGANPDLAVIAELARFAVCAQSLWLV